MARSKVLVELLREDYSTGLNGPVPISSRRPTWHLAALWTTLAANFSFLFLGVTLHAAGYSLPEAFGTVVLGCAIYLAYAVPAARLGSETGQTHSLLTRSVFGRAGSWLVSGFILVAPLGWVGFTAGLLAQVATGLYGIRHVEALTIAWIHRRSWCWPLIDCSDVGRFAVSVGVRNPPISWSARSGGWFSGRLGWWCGLRRPPVPVR